MDVFENMYGNISRYIFFFLLWIIENNELSCVFILKFIISVIKLDNFSSEARAEFCFVFFLSFIIPLFLFSKESFGGPNESYNIKILKNIKIY